jgi:hypothetical protein
MRITTPALALALATPGLAWSQGTPNPDGKAAFDRVHSNAAEITIAREQERWECSVDFWRMPLARPGTLRRRRAPVGARGGGSVAAEMSAVAAGSLVVCTGRTRLARSA